jgi:LacI family transcriptional regulator
MSDIYNDKVTIYQVAKRANVSLATVSRVINGIPTVKEETRKKVEKAINDLGYTPSALAQSLALAKTTVIGIVVPSRNYSYVSLMMSAMLDVAKIYGYRCYVFPIYEADEDDVNLVLKQIIKSRVDGLLIYHPFFNENLDAISNLNIPFVYIGSKSVDISHGGSILIDFESMLRKILDDYTKNSTKTVTFINYPYSIISDAIKQIENIHVNDLPLAKQHIIPIEDSYALTYKYFSDIFANKEMLNSLFIVPRDSLGCAIVNAANDNNISIPDDIEVISIVSSKYSVIVRPLLSSFESDFYEIGSIGMRMLTKLLKSSLQTQTFEYKFKYIKRGTSLL